MTNGFMLMCQEDTCLRPFWSPTLDKQFCPDCEAARTPEPDACPICLVGAIVPNNDPIAGDDPDGARFRCDYCGSLFDVTPSETLKPEYWEPEFGPIQRTDLPY